MKTSDYYGEDKIKERAIEWLENAEEGCCYGSDLHYEIFYKDYFIIGNFESKQWLGENVFDVLRTIKEYEESNFGKVSTDLSNPEKVVNMYAYIIGYYILNESKALGQSCVRLLTKEDIKNIINELSS